MKDIYNKPLEFWKNVFTSKEVHWPENKTINIQDLDKAVNWVIDGSESIVDFGCGSGVMLMYAMNKGIKEGIGIDLCKEAIDNATKCANEKGNQDIRFFHGSIDKLKALEINSIDGAICSNIIDNLTEEDAMDVLKALFDCLKPTGKLLVKMNPYIEPADFEKNSITVIEEDLLDDGLLLLNKENNRWKNMWEPMFKTVYEGTIYYEQHDVKNRVFYLEKKA